MSSLQEFLLGIIATASLAVGLFFLRFWRRVHDRFFLLFAIAFFLLAVSWTVSAFLTLNEASFLVYVVRVLAYCCIIAAIIDRNRSAARRHAPTHP